ncbi:hypothetical protein B0J13DRAFT_552339 [Dactylonectria estremocensis]|uniref:Uncharacterized protein n=1 Tax=Dactylonectria estremocensis TaxID=1079267 RepID=A0A9P9EX39_9HYPO|nr:hypothetical protein B0J13DRAFT_552339 [Dactylonectria estremocensis]
MYFPALIVTTLAVLMGSTDAWTVDILEHHAQCNPSEGTRIRHIYSRTQQCLTFGDDWSRVSTECTEFRWTNGRPDGPGGCTTDDTAEFDKLRPSAIRWDRRDSGRETKCTFYLGRDCQAEVPPNSGPNQVCIDEFFNNNNVPEPNPMRIQSFRCTDPEMNEDKLADGIPGR